MNTSPRDEEVTRWLKELWGDEKFELYFNEGVFAGSFTRESCLVTRDDNEYFLKRYHSKANLHFRGLAEYYNYCHRGYDRHPIFPRLIATLPPGHDEQDLLPQAILITYYPYEFQVSSLLDALACTLSLATVFNYFSEDGRIYFDLKRQSLRVDHDGGLHLIDFTDLLTPEEICAHKTAVANLDVAPPEAREYQQAYLDYWQKGAPFRNMMTAVEDLEPDSYQSFGLGKLFLSLLDGGSPSYQLLQRWIWNGNGASQVEFMTAEQAAILNLLERMLAPSRHERATLDQIRTDIWALLGPRLINESSTASVNRKRARDLLRTTTCEPTDALAKEIHTALARFWR